MALSLLISLRGMAGRLRRILDRQLHAGRRRRALASLGSNPAPTRYLVLCYGNICRSPYAARLLRNALASQAMAPVVQEGGFFGPDRAAPAMAQKVAAERGLVNLSNHCSRLVTSEDIRQADLTIVMEPSHRRRLATSFGIQPPRVLILGDLDPSPIERRGIPDPYGGKAEDFHQAYARIERCVAALAEVVSPAGQARAD